MGDARKLETELQEIFTNITTADPTLSGTQKDGNFGRNRIQFTTPAVAGTEIAVAHGLGRVPVGCDFGVMPITTNGGTVRARVSKPADKSFLYMKFLDPADQSVLISVAVF